MSIVSVYHDRNKVVIASDDAECNEDPATLEKRKVASRSCKFVLVGCGLFASVGRAVVTHKLFAGIPRMVAAERFNFGHLSEVLPPVLRLAWSNRPAAMLSSAADMQDCLLVGVDAKKIRCYVFRSSQDFQPIETTRSSDNRVVILGGYDLLDEARFRKFTLDVGVVGERKRAPWIAAQMRSLINEISAQHPEAIGQASYFAALDREASIALPPEFPSAPSTLSTSHPELGSKLAALATGGNFFIGSITTPKAGAPDTVGNNDGGVAAQLGQTNILSMSVPVQSNQQGNGAVTNPENAVDGDLTTFAKVTVEGNGATDNTMNFSLIGPPGFNSSYSSATLNIDLAVPTNGLNGTGIVVDVAASIDGGNTVFSTPLILNAGASASRRTYSVALPVGKNMSQVQVLISAEANGIFNGNTSGNLEIDVYDARIVAIQ